MPYEPESDFLDPNLFKKALIGWGAGCAYYFDGSSQEYLELSQSSEHAAYTQNLALEPTDGRFESRLKNIATGTATALVVGPALQAVAKPISKGANWLYDKMTKNRARNNFNISPKLRQRRFTPAFDQIESFSVKSAFSGAPYPKEKLTILVKYLEKRGIHVYGTKGNPKFVGMWDGTGQIYLPANPTILQIKHELSHYLDFKNLGVHEYVKLSRYDRERLVLERLQNNRLWTGLNDLEREFSRNYVDSLKPKANTVRFKNE